MAPVPASVAKQAELLRLDGNTFFKKDRIGAAIDAYTEAITLCPDVAVYWTNRALCHRRRNDWTRVEEDCRKALELDNSSVKVQIPLEGCLEDVVGCANAYAVQYHSQCVETFLMMISEKNYTAEEEAHYMLGLSLLERRDYTNGIKELEKALDLGRGANPVSYMVEEIWQVLAKAKYTEWENQSSERSWKLQSLKEECEKALTERYLLDIGVNGELKEEAASHSEQLQYLAEVFKRASSSDNQRDVPDYLCCKITLDIFRDPVITPCGITYERGVLLDHLQRVGRFDPITRVPLEPHQLVPNLAIKEAVQSFLKEHGWAYRFG